MRRAEEYFWISKIFLALCCAIRVFGSGAETEIIADNHFRRGFILWAPKPGKHVRYGEAPGFEQNSKPVWGLSQWSSKYPLDAPAAPAERTGNIVLSNIAKSVTLGRSGFDLSFGVDTAVEYGPAARKQNQPWVHLLAEQEFEHPPFLQRISEARFHLEARLLNATNLHRGDYNPGLHAAQYQVFFTVQNRNRQSPGFGDLLWFGIPVYDSRHEHPLEFKSKDFGGTEKFIFTPAAINFTSASAHDGSWFTIDRDLLPLMREGLETAWSRGFLAASTNQSDYAIGGMNIGWEVPGTFNVELAVRDLSLKIREIDTTWRFQTNVVEGWRVLIDERLFANNRAATEKALELLRKQLREISEKVPASAVEKLRQVTLWFSPRYPGVALKAEYHPGAGWLREHGRNPEMAKGVEFTNIPEFETETRRMPNFTLHELAHAFHDRFLSGGFGNPEIKAAYNRAKASGSYDRVERWNGDGKPKTTERAYAMTNPMEYFAEMSEAFFSRNDFYPFNREELRQHDPEMERLLQRLWGETE